MSRWSTKIKDEAGKVDCMGWIASAWDSAGNIFGDDVIESRGNGGYPDIYTIYVKTLRDFLNTPSRHEGLTKNIYGSWDFTQPLDPQLILDEIKDLNDNEKVNIVEFDES